MLTGEILCPHTCSKPVTISDTPSSDTASLASSFWKLMSAMLASLEFLDSHASRNGFKSSCAQDHFFISDSDIQSQRS